MTIFLWVIAIVIGSVIIYRVSQLLYKWYRLVNRVGKSVNRYIESE